METAEIRFLRAIAGYSMTVRNGNEIKRTWNKWWLWWWWWWWQQQMRYVNM